MTEQIITKNLYSIMSLSGYSPSSSASGGYMMTTSLIRRSFTDTAPYYTFRQPDVTKIPMYIYLRPVNYLKALSELTESEIYGANASIFTNVDGVFNETCYKITGDSTGLPTGIKLVLTYTNTGTDNVTVNGVTLYHVDGSNYSNLIHTKFNESIVVAPTEAYSFTLELDNIYQTFPTTIGS